MAQLEKEIERKCRRIAEREGFELLKIISPNRTGIPDRLFVGPEMIWMEFKQLKKGPSSQQERTLKRLRELGHRAYKVDSVAMFTMITGLVE